MRKRSGRFVNTGTLVGQSTYQIDLPDPCTWNRCAEQDERTAYIRAHCRRADWSKEILPSRSRLMVRYHFLDQEDAMAFKLRFH